MVDRRAFLGQLLAGAAVVPLVVTGKQPSPLEPLEEYEVAWCGEVMFTVKVWSEKKLSVYRNSKRLRLTKTLKDGWKVFRCSGGTEIMLRRLKQDVLHVGYWSIVEPNRFESRGLYSTEPMAFKTTG